MKDEDQTAIEKITEKGAAPGTALVNQVGYKQPPMQSRFKPGQSGNPTGRAKGSLNIESLFQKILKERITVREGGRVRKISKAEAILRSLVLAAMKGDAKSVVTVFRLAEQTGQLQNPSEPVTTIRRIIVGWKGQFDSGVAEIGGESSEGSS